MTLAVLYLLIPSLVALLAWSVLHASMVWPDIAPLHRLTVVRVRDALAHAFGA